MSAEGVRWLRGGGAKDGEQATKSGVCDEAGATAVDRSWFGGGGIGFVTLLVLSLSPVPPWCENGPHTNPWHSSVLLPSPDSRPDPPISACSFPDRSLQASSLDRFNVNISFSKNWEHLQNKFVGTGHPDITKHEWAVQHHRDTTASFLGHASQLAYFALAENESPARVRLSLLESMLQPCGPPPAKKDPLDDDEADAAEPKSKGASEAKSKEVEDDAPAASGGGGGGGGGGGRA